MGRQAQARLSSTDCPEPHIEEGLEWEPAVPEETGEDPGQTVSHCLTSPPACGRCCLSSPVFEHYLCQLLTSGEIMMSHF